MLHVGVLVLGVADVQRAAAFWSAALDYELWTDGFGGWATVLVPRSGSGSGLAIALQRSGTTPQDHPRLHLDLHVADAAEQAAEAERLVSLGASRVEWDSYPDDPDFVVLADTEGNRFCIVDLGHDGFSRAQSAAHLPRLIPCPVPDPAPEAHNLRSVEGAASAVSVGRGSVASCRRRRRTPAAARRSARPEAG